MSKCYVRPNVSITENQYYKKGDPNCVIKLNNNFATNFSEFSLWNHTLKRNYPITINYVISVPSSYRIKWGRFFYNIKISKAEQKKDIYLYDI